jgi:hypothetical protein
VDQELSTANLVAKPRCKNATGFPDKAKVGDLL